jgi:hypothetical protein
VTNLADSGIGSLRDALASTPAGGIVDFQSGLSGTLTLTTGELVIDHNLTISGPGSVTISGGHASREFTINAGVTAAISGLTLADGSVAAPATTGFAGAIENRGTLSLSNCTVSNNYAQYGAGGIENWGTLTVNACTLSGNSNDPSLGGGGGGIANEGGQLTVTNSSFSGNLAQQGGGIINNSGTLVVDGSTFSVNHAGTGGAIFNVFATATATISNSTISNNFADTSAGYAGGGLSNNLGQMTVTGCTVSGNSAGTASIAGGGGGIYEQDGTLIVSDCTLYGNYAAQGGGLDNHVGTGTPVATINNSTVSGNSANLGGGVANLTGTVNAHDSMFAGNTAPGSNDFYGPLTSQGHNLVGIGDGGSGYSATDLVGTLALPIDPKLGPLQNNGGSTKTLALLATSPAIIAGDITGAPQWDQRGPGYARVVNGTIDIGAFEVQAAVTTPTIEVSGGTFPYIGGGRYVGAVALASDGVTQVAGSFTFTYNGSTNVPQTVGTYTVVANFTSSDPHYGNASGTGSITITPVVPITVTFAGTGNFPYDGQPHVVSATAVGVDGMPVNGTFSYTYNGSSTPPVALGSYTVVATFSSSDPNYLGTAGTFTLNIVVGPVAPTIVVAGGTFANDGQPHPDQALALTGDGTTWVSGSFTYTYNGSTTPPSAPGVYVVVATFTSSDPLYTNATGTGVIDIAPGRVMPTFTTPLLPQIFTFDGSSHAYTSTVVGTDGKTPVNGTLTVTYNDSSTPPSAVGQYLVQFTFQSNDPTYYTVSGLAYWTILPAPVVKVVGGTFPSDGNPHSATAIAYNVDGVTQLGGTFSYTYNGSTTPPTAPGTYAVVATFTSNDPNYGNATGMGTLIIGSSQATPPKITKQPKSQTVAEGKTVSFTAKASGSPAPTVQWQVSSDGGKTFVDLAGATKSTLTFTAHAGDNGKVYRAVFTNSSGTTVTDDATLVVRFARITLNPVDQEVHVGSTVTFTAVAVANPTPTIRWQVSKDGGKTWTNIAGSGTTLKFVVKAGQNGYKYRATFTNALGSVTSDITTLTVDD